jgi:histidyl-tRNA synthetase
MRFEYSALRGFRDLLPQDMIARDKVIAVIKRVFESYGFVPIATPALEHKKALLAYEETEACFTTDEYERLLAAFPKAESVLEPYVRDDGGIIRVAAYKMQLAELKKLGKEAHEQVVARTDANKQIYLFEEPEGDSVGLRFDLTVPLSRFIAQHRDLPRPFKRYQIQPVWRYDKPDPGRFREFMQFDIDTVGTGSMLADFEIMAAMYECLRELGADFLIRFSSRKVLNSLLAFAGIPQELSHPTFRVIDKLERCGIDAVAAELGPGRTDESGDEIKGIGLDSTQIERIVHFLNLPRQSRDETLTALGDLFHSVAGHEEGISELREISDYLDALEMTDDDVCIDLTIARGLDYYTGPVFEAILTDAREFGSVMGGGRYDDLIGHFTGRPEPATGASIGIDRLMSAVTKIEKTEFRSSTADVLITVFDRDMLVDYQKIARDLRSGGIKTELYVGRQNITKQLKYADRKGIPIAVMIGPDELSKGEASIKDLRVMKESQVHVEARQEWVEMRVGQRAVPMGDLKREIISLLELDKK